MLPEKSNKANIKIILFCMRLNKLLTIIAVMNLINTARALACPALSGKNFNAPAIDVGVMSPSPSEHNMIRLQYSGHTD